MERRIPAGSMAAVFIAVLITGHAPIVPAQLAPPAETAPYEALGKGAGARTVASLRPRSVDLTLEVRNIVIGPGGAETIPAPERAILELRSGGLLTTIAGEEQERRIGDFWTVGKGSVMRVKNHSQASVIRAIYLREGAR